MADIETIPLCCSLFWTMPETITKEKNVDIIPFFTWIHFPHRIDKEHHQHLTAVFHPGIG